MTKFFDMTKEREIEIIWTPQMSRFFYDNLKGKYEPHQFYFKDGIRLAKISTNEYLLLDKYLKGKLHWFEYKGE